MKAYDYIVVGAGSAGCVLATRLSEDPTCSVLLIEAGGRPTGLLRDMPAAIFKMMGGRPDLNWNFVGEPEPALGGRRIALPRGKTLGGSSQINGLVYARGHRRDYDDWSRLGCDGWSYDEVLPYFKRMESSWAGAGTYHGDLGPLGVSSPRDEALMFNIYRDAAAQAGHAITDDYHGENSEGFTRIELTTRRGRRAGTFRAYLASALDRPNLTLLPQVQATRVMMRNRRAVGVEFVHHGQISEVHAEREVILCGGTYGSAQMLLLSGIGPADELDAVGVRPAVDLPGVGANLIEHPMAWLHYKTVAPTALDRLRFDRATRSVLRWALRGDGLFATNFSAGHLFARTDVGCDRPDVQFSCFALDKSAKMWFPLIKPRAPFGLGLMIQALRPLSRGKLRLASKDPLAPPRITLNLLADPADMTCLVDAVKMGRDLFAQPALQGLGVLEDAPGPRCSSRSEVEAYIRQTCAIAQHPVGTCKMGVDAHSVVDHRLRVIGVEGLRVADASIMPTIPGGNTNAPTIMIGEKAADLVRGVTGSLNHQG